MKRSLINLLITILMVVGIGNVSAATINVNDEYNSGVLNSNLTVNGLFVMKDEVNEGESYDKTAFAIHKYQFTNKETSASYQAYCMDPHKYHGTNYKIDRILTKDTRYDAAFDYGILEMLKATYNGSFSFTSSGYSGTVSGDEAYAATSIAIRAYSLGLFNYGTDVNNTNFQSGAKTASAHVYRGLQWASLYPESAKVILGNNCGSDENCYINAFKSNGYAWFKDTYRLYGDDGTSGERVIYAAQQIYRIGLEAAAKYKTGNVAQAVIELDIKNTDSQTNGNITTDYIYANFKIENLNDASGYIRNVQFDCPTCASKGITFQGMEYKNAAGVWTKFDSSTNLAKLVQLVNGLRLGKLETRFIVNKNVTDGCSNASYTISYQYYDPDNDYMGALLRPTETNRQRFFIITKISDAEKNNGITDSKSGTIKCAQESCDTEISVPVCSANESDAVATVNAPEKIKSCVIDNSDDAGNSYQLPSNRGGVDNDYCKIFCKEDYSEIKLNPEVPNVVCGGYFSLTSKVKGKKDCYTGGDTTKDSLNGEKSIDKDQYLKDIKAAQIEMVDAYNEYLRWKTAYDAPAQSDRWTYFSYSPSRCCSCPEGESGCCGECGCNATNSCPHYYLTGYATGFNYTENANGTLNITQNKRLDYSYGFSGEDGGSSGGCGGSCSAGSSATLKANLKRTYLDPAETRLNNAIKAYEQIIKNYNACTTAWTNNYEFNPKLKFYYNEYHYNNTSTPYYDLLNNLGNDDTYYLTANSGSLSTNSTITICTGAADDKYNCINPSSNQITLSGTAETGAKGKWNENNSYTGVFETINYVECTTSGCSRPGRPISKATFIKKTVEKEQSYSTPSYFYQIESNGRITINQGYVGNKLQLEQLIEKLPVSTSTTGGGIFKLMLEDLGEFYDTGKLGRIFDFKSDFETSSVAYAKGSVDTFTGEYVCHYYSPCKPKECPNCEFTCEGDSCSWRTCPECKFTCANCLFDLGQLQATVKTISATTVQTVNRNYGYNWITSQQLNNMNLSSSIKSQLSLVTDKADATITEIEKYNETIFNSNKIGDSSSLAFSVRLTSDMIDDIKKYNREQEEYGGYANDSLTCSDATVNGNTYKNIYCYSDFIDDMLAKYGNNFTVPDARLNKNSSSYWTLWTNYVYNEDVIGGPSWK